MEREMTFRPMMKDLENFSNYIDYMESKGAHKAGIVKIIPPHEWNPRKNGYDLNEIDFIISSPISQTISGKYGKYISINNSYNKSIKLKNFYELTKTKEYQTPKHFDHDDLESKFWKDLSLNSSLYGTNINGTLFDSDLEKLNLNNLSTILDFVKDDYGTKINGINTPYLYVGMWKTYFPWHTENMDLYSICYLHYGEPKTWYVIPPAYGKKFENLVYKIFKDENQECTTFLRHKTILIHPKILKQNKIPYYKIVQEPKEFIITFPFAYNSGFNHGFNIMETINFATIRWIEYGKRATLCQCQCRTDMIRISMNSYVKRYQPEKYENWLLGDDYGTHPEESENQLYSVPLPIFQGSKIKKTENMRKQENANVPSMVLKRNREKNVQDDQNKMEIIKFNSKEMKKFNEVSNDKNRIASVKNLSKEEDFIKNPERMRFLTKIIDLYEKDENNCEN